jgi:hypothetical protein
MKIGSIQSAVFLILASLFATPLLAASYYPVRLDDPTAVYLTPDKFPVHGDGVTDDSAAIQQAIDQVEATTKQGIVFIPSGGIASPKPFTYGRPCASLGTARPGPCWFWEKILPAFSRASDTWCCSPAAGIPISAKGLFRGRYRPQK